MNNKLRKAIKFLIPSRLAEIIRAFAPSLRTRKARLAFEPAGTEPGWLDYRYLEEYCAAYPPRPEYGYDSQSVEKRGIAVGRNLIRSIPQRIASSLELGCSDGMVSLYLSSKNIAATAIDSNDARFDSRVSNSNVKLRTMDARNLKFDDNSFDLVFSFNAFEHFEDPEKVLIEAIRVVKEHGYLFFDFGPLYYSAWGAHLYREIPVPFCHLLFKQADLERIAGDKNLGILDFKQTNGWSLDAFIGLWGKYSHLAKIVSYQEIPELSQTRLISKHPACFKSKIDRFENLIISRIRILLQKSAA